MMLSASDSSGQAPATDLVQIEHLAGIIADGVRDGLTQGVEKAIAAGIAAGMAALKEGL